jgi:hypothetical protein
MRWWATVFPLQDFTFLGKDGSKSNCILHTIKQVGGRPKRANRGHNSTLTPKTTDIVAKTLVQNTTILGQDQTYEEQCRCKVWQHNDGTAAQTIILLPNFASVLQVNMFLYKFLWKLLQLCTRFV